MKIVSLSLTETDRTVRQRRFGQFAKADGHDVTYVGGYAPMMTDEMLLELDPIDGIRACQINTKWAHEFSQYVATLEPDVIYCHQLDGLDLLFSQSIPGDLWHIDPSVYPPPKRPKWLDGIRVIYEVAELETDRAVPNQPFIRMWARAKRAQAYYKMLGYNDYVAVSKSLGVEMGQTGKWIPNAPYRVKRELDKGLIKRMANITDDKPIFVFIGAENPYRLFHQGAIACKKLGWHYVCFVSPRPNMIGYQDAHTIAAKLDTMFLPLQPYPHPSEERPTILDAISGASLGFAGVCRNHKNHIVSLPNKFFEYTFAGLPVVSCGSEEMRQLIWEHEIGATYNATADGLCDAMVKALDTKQEALEAFQDKYCFENAAAPVLREILNGNMDTNK